MAASRVRASCRHVIGTTIVQAVIPRIRSERAVSAGHLASLAGHPPMFVNHFRWRRNASNESTATLPRTERPHPPGTRGVERGDDCGSRRNHVASLTSWDGLVRSERPLDLDAVDDPTSDTGVERPKLARIGDDEAPLYERSGLFRGERRTICGGARRVTLPTVRVYSSGSDDRRAYRSTHWPRVSWHLELARPTRGG